MADHRILLSVATLAALAATLAALRRRARRRAARERVCWASAHQDEGARRDPSFVCSPVSSAIPRFVRSPALAVDGMVATAHQDEGARRDPSFVCAPVSSAIPRFVRSPALAVDGMVASSQTLATQAGLEILRIGGNAIDAAVAVAAALAVLEPCSNGIGGDFFMLAYDATSRRVAALNGSGRSPAALTLERARSECGLSLSTPTLPAVHAHTVTVPGAIAAWCDAVDALGSGRVSMGALLARAIELAERGFAVAPVTARYWAEGAQLLRDASPGGRELLTADGSAPTEGARFRRPELAKVLRAVAARGRRAFYEGEVAEAVVRAVAEAGGCMSLADLAAHRGEFAAPICARYYGVRVWEHPPNGGGLTALLALNILRALEERGAIPAWPRRARAPPDAAAEELPAALEVALVHAQIEALRLAYADTAFYLGDPDAERVPAEALLADAYAAERAALFEPARALAHVPRGAPREDACTVSWQVVDARGNAVSAVQSNYLGFGTGIVPRGCGFTLQNRGLNFSTLDGVPNALRPGVRPYHTILPALVTDEASGELVATLTNMGGYMQPQGHVQLVCRLVRRGLCPQEAVDLPRFCVLPMFPGTAPCSPVVAVEDTFRPEVVAGLRALGHTLKVVSGSQRTVVGRAQVIMRATNGVLWGASDGRADGMAAGR